MPANWRQIAQRADDLVDQYWGEKVIFRPMTQADEYAALSPDGSRAVFESRGVFERPDAMPVDTQGGNRTRADFMLIIQDRLLPPYTVKNEDWVEFPEQNGMILQVSFVDSDATGRSTVHLLRK